MKGQKTCDSFYEQRDILGRGYTPLKSSRFSEIPTFMRAPQCSDLSQIDVGIIGIPYDGGLTCRTGARMGPGRSATSRRLCVRSMWRLGHDLLSRPESLIWVMYGSRTCLTWNRHLQTLRNSTIAIIAAALTLAAHRTFSARAPGTTPGPMARATHNRAKLPHQIALGAAMKGRPRPTDTLSGVFQPHRLRLMQAVRIASTQRCRPRHLRTPPSGRDAALPDCRDLLP